MKPVSLSRMAVLFVRVGSLTFGGGSPTMAAFYTELVTARQWLSRETYGLVYALARITPGTNLLAFGAGVAWELRGWSGAVLGVLAMSLPAAFCTVLLSAGYDAWKENAVARAAIAGVLAGAVGLMATSAWQLLEPHLKSGRPRRIARALAFAGGSALLSLGCGMPPVAVLGVAAAIGWMWQERAA